MKLINIEPFLTPQRLRNLLLTIGDKSLLLNDLKRLISPGVPHSPTVDQLVTAAEKLDLILVENNDVKLLTNFKYIKDENAYKQMLARKMTNDPKYLEVLQNVLSNQHLLFSTSIETMNDNFKSMFNVTGNYFKGFRFWFEYLGYGFLMSSGIVVAPIKRIELELEHLLKNKKINLVDFLNELCTQMPEFQDMFDQKNVDQILSLTLLHFEELGLIRLSFQSDAFKFATLNHDGMSTNYSDIEKV